MDAEPAGGGGGFAEDRHLAFRQGQEERRSRERVEAARRQSLRGEGVADNAAYTPADWDAPHGSWLVAMPELREVPVPDVVTGRAQRQQHFRKELSAERRSAVEEAATAIQQMLSEQANDVIDEIEADAADGHVDSDEREVRWKMGIELGDEAAVTEPIRA